MMTYTINKLDKCIILHVYVLYVHLVRVHSIYMCVIMLINTGLRINQTLGIGKWVWIIGWGGSVSCTQNAGALQIS